MEFICDLQRSKDLTTLHWPTFWNVAKAFELRAKTFSI